jgi:hypothetical protein
MAAFYLRVGGYYIEPEDAPDTTDFPVSEELHNNNSLTIIIDPTINLPRSIVHG